MSAISASSHPPPSCPRGDWVRWGGREGRGEERWAYGVAADGGDDGFADAGDVLPVREELARVHFGDFYSIAAIMFKNIPKNR